MWGPGGPSQWGGPDVGPRGRGGEPNNKGPPPLLPNLASSQSTGLRKY